MVNIVQMILSHLLREKRYIRKVVPHLKSSYFPEQYEKITFNIIKDYVKKYKELPNIQQLKISLSESTGMSESVYNETMDYIESLKEVEHCEFDWLVDQTEKWAQNQAMENAILDAVRVIEEGQDRVQIPEMMRKALNVTFDNRLGLEFLDESDIKIRYDMYQEKMSKFPTMIGAIDDVTAGGFEKKSLNMFFGETNIGKTALMIAICSNFLRQGFNGVYVTLEMSEEKIMRRFDANALDVDINDVEDVEYSKYHDNLIQIKNKGTGRLLVREFPAGFTTAEHIKNLIEELHVKKGFKPDFVVVDYLNLMRPITMGAGSNTYSRLKDIAEEVRGLMCIYEICGLSVTQINREGYGKKNPGLDNVSESMAVAHTVDYFGAVVMDEELEKEKQQLWIPKKNRYDSLKNVKKLVNVNFSRCIVTDDKEGSDSLNGLKVKGFEQQEQERRKKRQKGVKVNIKDKDVDNDIDELLSMIDDD